MGNWERTIKEGIRDGRDEMADSYR